MILICLKNYKYELKSRYDTTDGNPTNQVIANKIIFI